MYVHVTSLKESTEIVGGVVDIPPSETEAVENKKEEHDNNRNDSNDRNIKRSEVKRSFCLNATCF